MRLKRIREYDLARVVAKGVQRHNGVFLTPRRILSRPHFAIRVNGRLAGWIGYEARRPGVYELMHLSVLPRYRRRRLAERATARMLAMARHAGGRSVYARIKRGNHAPQRLLRKFSFRRVACGPVYRFARSV